MPRAPELLYKLRLCVALLCCWYGVVAPARADFFDSIQRSFDRLGLFQHDQITGQNTLTLQQNLLEGSQSAFEGQSWQTGSFYRQSSLHLEGPIWKEFGFQADFSDAGYGSNYSRWVVGYVGKNTALYYGDLSVNLSGNEFANLSQSLMGWQVDERLPGNGLMRAFYCQEQGATQTQTISGNDTPGPYFLTYTPIIEGSLRVKVDEQPKELGTDYRVDYQTGELWFEPTTGPPTIISSTSTISVSYQSSGGSSSAETLFGLRAEEPIAHGRGLVGTTILRQERPGTGASDTVGYKEDDYQGSGTTGPFDTNYRPILANGASGVYQGVNQTFATPLLVLVDNIQQTEGVDYDSYRTLGEIIFRKMIPPTSLVKIQYYYSLGAGTTSPNLSLNGFDFSYNLTHDLQLATQFAESEGGVYGGTGTALSTVLNFNRPSLQFSGEWRNMTPTFTYMDSSGFAQQESGFQTSLSWKPIRFLCVNDSFSSMESASGLQFGYNGLSSPTTGLSAQQTTTTTPTQDIRTLNHSLSLSYARPKCPSVSLSSNFMSNAGGSTGGSSYQTDQVQISQDFGSKLHAQAQWQANTQSYSLADTTDTSGLTGSRCDTGTFALTWTPSSALSLSANLNTNRTTGAAALGSTTNGDSIANCWQISAKWQPSERFSVNIDHSANVSNGGLGSSETLATSSPADTLQLMTSLDQAATGESSQLQDINTTVAISYQLSRDLTCGLNLGDRKYNATGGVGYLANSEDLSRNFSLTWRCSPTLTFTGTVGSDDMTFLQAGQGAVTNNMYAATLNYSPLKTPWGAGMTLNRQIGASPTYIDFGSQQRYLMVGTDLTDLTTQIRYQLAGQSNVFSNIELANFNSGDSAYIKTTAEIGLQRHLSSTTDLNFSYRLTRNLGCMPSSPLYSGGNPASQSYQANTFGVTIDTSFGSGGSSASSFSAPSGGGGSSFGSVSGLGGMGGSGLASFGGYQPGLDSMAGGAGFTNSGLGSGSFAGGNSTFGANAGQVSSQMPTWSAGSGQGGFTSGLGNFQQKAPLPVAPGQPPALNWNTAIPGLPGSAPTAGAPDDWDEGLSRWDFSAPGKWW